MMMMVISSAAAAVPVQSLEPVMKARGTGLCLGERDRGEYCP